MYCLLQVFLKCWRVPGMAGGKVKCHLCKAKQGSLSHILAGCNNGSGSALRQGRYTWRHDSIIPALYKQIRSMRNEGKTGLKLGRCKKPSQPIIFKSGSGAAFAAPSISQEGAPLFEESDDWVLQLNLNYAEADQKQRLSCTRRSKRPAA